MKPSDELEKLREENAWLTEYALQDKETIENLMARIRLVRESIERAIDNKPDSELQAWLDILRGAK